MSLGAMWIRHLESDSGTRAARLESEAVERHRATPSYVNAYAISELALQNDSSVCVCKTSMFVEI